MKQSTIQHKPLRLESSAKRFFFLSDSLKTSIIFLMVLFFSLANNLTHAQLATWSGPWSGIGVSPLNASTLGTNVSSATLSRYILGGASSTTRYSSRDWNNSNYYLAILITAKAGYTLKMNSQTISIAMGSSGGGPSGYYVYSSVDNYTVSLGTLNSSCSGQQDNMITLPATGYNDIISITFRIVGIQTGCSSTIAGTGTGGPSSIIINGTAALQSNFYVNDNSITGNIYTTAIGNDANPGTPAAPFATIQHAISVANPGNTIYVDAGTYAENVVVTKEVSINGAGQINTIIMPAISSPNSCSGSSLCPDASNIFLVQANNVTIQNLTIDGNNPSISSGVNAGGSDIDARNGIITDHTSGLIFNNLNVNHVTVKNIFLRGIYASTGGTFSFYDNIVNNIQADPSSIAMFNYGGSGSFSNNTVTNSNDAISSNHSSGTTYSGNTISNCGSGIHTDNNGDGGGISDDIFGNTISNSTTGGYGIWVFAPYKNVTVHENSISNVDVGLASSGSYVAVTPVFSNNIIDGQNKEYSIGMYATTQIWGYGDGNNSTSFINNYIINNADGFDLETSAGYILNFDAHFNSVTGNNNSAVSVISAGTNNINMSCNWWGTTVSATIASSIHGTVDYIPYLTRETDAQPATIGFQTNEVCTTCAITASVDANYPHNSSCFGASDGAINVTISGGSNNYVYSWTGTDYLNNSYTSSSQNISALKTGTYNLAVTDMNGCSTNISNITVTQPLAISASISGNPTICSGNSTNLSVSFTNGVAPWTFVYTDGSNHSVTTSDNPYSLSVSPNSNTNYSLISVVDNNGCSGIVDGSATVSIYGTTITSGVCESCSSPANLCAEGNPIIFSVSTPSGGDGNYSYQWQQSEGCTDIWINAVAEDGITNLLSFNPPALSTSTCYRLKITDGCGNTGYSDIKTYNVVPDPVSNSINPSPISGTTICVGSNVSATFNNGSDGTGTISDIFQYSTDGGNSWNDYTSGAFITATTEMVGTNKIIIRTQRMASGMGCNNGAINVVQWSVAALPIATFSKSPNENICASINVTYTTQPLMSNYVWNVPGALGTDYSIISGGISLTDNTVTLKWLTSGSKTVTVNYTDANGCTAINEASSVINVHALPTATISYKGSPYCAVGTATVTQKGQGNGTYSSTTGLSINEGTGDIDLVASTPGTYTVTYSFTDGYDCSNIATTIVTIQPLPIATISGTTAVCLNSAPPSITFSNPKELPVAITYHINSGADLTINVDANSTNTVTAPTNVAGTFIYTLTSVQYQGIPSCPNTITGQTATVTVAAAPFINNWPATIEFSTGPGSTSCDVEVAGHFTPPYATSSCAPVTTSIHAVNIAASIDATFTDALPTGPGVLPAGSRFPVGTTTLTYTFTDANNNSSSCTFDIIVTDNAPPTIICPSDIVTSADNEACFATLTADAIGTPTTSDNCRIFPYSFHRSDNNSRLTAPYPIGTTTITWSVTDIHGNASYCMQTITVTGNIINMKCPSNIIVDADNGYCSASNVSVGLPDVSPACAILTVIGVRSDDPHITGHPLLLTDPYPGGTTTITWIALDYSFNAVATCLQTITVNDNQPPVISDCPSNIISCNPVVTWTAPKASDNCGVTNFSSNYSPGYRFPAGTTTVTYTASDAAGNSTTRSFTVTVNTPIAPIVTVINNCGSTTLTASNYTGSLLWSNSSTNSSITVTDATSYSVTQTTDGCTSPAGKGTATPKLIPDAPIVTVTQPTCSIATGTITVNTFPGMNYSINGSGYFNTSGVFSSLIADSYNVTAKNSDGCISAMTIATITDQPITPIASNQPDQTQCNNSTFTMTQSGTGTWSLISGSASITTVSSPTTTVTGVAAGSSVKVRWTVTNGICTVSDDVVLTNNNSSSVSIICPKAITVSANTNQCYATNIKLGTTVTTGSGTLTITNNAPSIFPVGTTIVTWIVTSSECGFGSCTQLVTVTEKVKPVISHCANPKSAYADINCRAVVPDFTGSINASDNCTSQSQLVITQQPAAGSIVSTGVTNVIITVKDASGNAASCTTTFTVTDNTPPAISCAGNITANAGSNCSASIAIPKPVFSDNCGIVTKLTWVMTGTTTGSSSSGGINYIGTKTFNKGITTITYTAKDAAGNSSSCSFRVTVNDNTAPSIKCPSNITVSAGKNCSVSVSTANPTFSDNCGVVILSWGMTGATSGNSSSSGINYVGKRAFNKGVTTITYTAKDAAGNSTSCSFTVTVTSTNNGCNQSASISTSGNLKLPVVTVNNLSINAFPNPTQSYFNLAIKSDSRETVTIRVFDISGRLLQQMSGSVDQLYRFGETFAAGTYVAEVLQGTQREVAKIIKK